MKKLILIATLGLFSCSTTGDLKPLPSPLSSPSVTPPVESSPKPSVSAEPSVIPSSIPSMVPTPIPAHIQEGLQENISGYESWLKINNELIPPTNSDPHAPGKGGKNVFVNQSLENITSNGKLKYPFPDKTLVVKQGFNADKGFIQLVAVMEKIKDYDPEHGDWKFSEYIRSSADEKFRLAFREQYVGAVMEP